MIDQLMEIFFESQEKYCCNNVAFPLLLPPSPSPFCLSSHSLVLLFLQSLLLIHTSLMFHSPSLSLISSLCSSLSSVSLTLFLLLFLSYSFLILFPSPLVFTLPFNQLLKVLKLELEMLNLSLPLLLRPPSPSNRVACQWTPSQIL